MPESHKDRVDRLFNAVKKKSKEQVRAQKKKQPKSKPKKTAPSLGGTIKAIRGRHKMLGSL